MKRLGGDTEIKIRWFDADLNESPVPNKPGRWLAWIEGRAPNGTPFRRSFTFFAFPKQIANQFAPDLTVEFQTSREPTLPQPGASTSPSLTGSEKT